jgi:hypothetical protein
MYSSIKAAFSTRFPGTSRGKTALRNHVKALKAYTNRAVAVAAIAEANAKAAASAAAAQEAAREALQDEQRRKAGSSLRSSRTKLKSKSFASGTPRQGGAWTPAENDFLRALMTTFPDKKEGKRVPANERVRGRLLE